MTQENNIKIPKGFSISKGSIDNPFTLEIRSDQFSYQKANCWVVENAILFISEKLNLLSSKKFQEIDSILESKLRKTQSLLLIYKKLNIKYCFLRQHTYDIVRWHSYADYYF